MTVLKLIIGKYIKIKIKDKQKESYKIGLLEANKQ